MEYEKNVSIIKILFKIKNIQKMGTCVLRQLKYIKIKPDSYEKYNSCINTYQEAMDYLLQSSGFLKCQFYNYSPTQSSKRFLINNLFIPSYKNFLKFQEDISSLKVENGYTENIHLIKDKTETINTSLNSILNELKDIG
ncbi:hypothetical protein Q428_12530 [Fervidicella metallireducens AeB]|uniref:Uncharacterized protein n=1 Tax=Fervidicella metallireducens AeB TaxID=1403537 RepID=A0A017RUP1_9CLOT|nr:hypothetical protein [Fervidicella metallireducens]EYE87590.1 hypothetical protein Q428_12530 [Fervidicella metallireducens AeB]